MWCEKYHRPYIFYCVNCVGLVLLCLEKMFVLTQSSFIHTSFKINGWVDLISEMKEYDDSSKCMINFPCCLTWILLPKKDLSMRDYLQEVLLWATTIWPLVLEVLLDSLSNNLYLQFVDQKVSKKTQIRKREHEHDPKCTNCSLCIKGFHFLKRLLNTFYHGTIDVNWLVYAGVDGWS